MLDPKVMGYFYTVKELRKNSLIVLKSRRQKMAADGCWNFEELVIDYYRVQKCMFMLAAIGVLQFFNNTKSLNYVREIYSELAIIMCVGASYGNPA